MSEYQGNEEEGNLTVILLDSILFTFLLVTLSLGGEKRQFSEFVILFALSLKKNRKVNFLWST